MLEESKIHDNEQGFKELAVAVIKQAYNDLLNLGEPHLYKLER